MVGQEARLAQPIDRRHKRLLLATVACILVAVVAVAVYGARQTNSYGSSANGCVTLSFASEMGSAAVHKCGLAAKEWCAFEDGRSDLEARLVGTQCRLAGYPKVASGGVGGVGGASGAGGAGAASGAGGAGAAGAAGGAGGASGAGAASGAGGAGGAGAAGGAGGASGAGAASGAGGAGGASGAEVASGAGGAGGAAATHS
jgi:hypothetical protein